MFTFDFDMDMDWDDAPLTESWMLQLWDIELDDTTLILTFRHKLRWCKLNFDSDIDWNDAPLT